MLQNAIDRILYSKTDSALRMRMRNVIFSHHYPNVALGPLEPLAVELEDIWELFFIERALETEIPEFDWENQDANNTEFSMHHVNGVVFYSVLMDNRPGSLIDTRFFFYEDPGDDFAGEISVVHVVPEWFFQDGPEAASFVIANAYYRVRTAAA